MRSVVMCTLALLTSIALAQTPTPRQGDSCPTSTYRSGEYCIPLNSTEDDKIIVKNGNDCPTGFYSAGDYCKQLSGSNREAIPREVDRCPTGWYRSGDYCVEQ